MMASFTFCIFFSVRRGFLPNAPRMLASPSAPFFFHATYHACTEGRDTLSFRATSACAVPRANIRPAFFLLASSALMSRRSRTGDGLVISPSYYMLVYYAKVSRGFMRIINAPEEDCHGSAAAAAIASPAENLGQALGNEDSLKCPQRTIWSKCSNRLAGGRYTRQFRANSKRGPSPVKAARFYNGL
jgi:hypothetical protein